MEPEQNYFPDETLVIIMLNLDDKPLRRLVTVNKQVKNLYNSEYFFELKLDYDDKKEKDKFDYKHQKKTD